MRVDRKSGYPLSLYNVNWGSQAATAEETSLDYLRAHESLLGITSVYDLTVAKVIETPGGAHVRFQQTYQGLPVKHGAVAVNLDKNNIVTFVMNHFKHGLEGINTTPQVSENEALDIVEQDLGEGVSLGALPRARLIIFQEPDTRASCLAWEVTVPGAAGFGSWEYIIDAVTGVIRNVEDLIVYYINGTGRVFDPDPRTTLNDDTLLDRGDSNYVELAGAYVTVDLLDLTDPIMTDSLEYRIQGRWARSESLGVDPRVTATETKPVVSGSSAFLSYRDSTLFSEATVYYHIDKMKRYMDSLGFSDAMSFPIRFDASNFEEDNAYYDPTDSTLHFGIGCVDDAEDADVILHEYNHALNYDILPGWGGGHMELMGEGYGDYFAVSYSRTKNAAFYPDWVFTWDGHVECWPGRTLSDALHYPEDCVYGPWGDPHEPGGLLWASCLMDMEESLGDRDVATSLVLEGMCSLDYGAEMSDAVEAILDADRKLYGGGHLGQLVKVFALRGFYPVISGRSYSSYSGWDTSVYVTGDITIEEYVTFLIQWSGTVVAIADNSDDTEGGIAQNKTEFRVDGVLVAGEPDQTTVSFVSAGDAPEPGDWYGIVASTPSGCLVMDNCEVRHAGKGCMLSESTYGSTIENTSFKSNEDAHLDIFGDVDATIRHCTFDVDSPFGIVIGNESSPSNTVVDSCTITGTENASYGISVSSGGPTLSDNTISGFPTGRGIKTDVSSSPSINGNSISDCKYGIRCEESSQPSIGDQSNITQIVDCTSGIYTEDTTSPDVGGVEINSCTIGIQTRDSSDPEIAGENTVAYCTKGLYAMDTSEPYIRHTVFDSCTTCGAQVTFAADPNLGTPGDAGCNSFYASASCPTYRHVMATKTRPAGLDSVKAVLNWWGTSDPDADCFCGWVDHTPWLNSDPNDARPGLGIWEDVLSFRPALWQNYPNPFGGATVISYQVPNPGADVALRVYDAMGRLVRTLVDKHQNPGPHDVIWSGCNNNGKTAPPGVYFYEIEIGDDFKASKKMAIVR